MEQAAPLIHWPDPIIELLGMVASFLAAGAVGFRLRAITGAMAAGGVDSAERRVLLDAENRGARIGLVGAVISVVLFATRLPAQAARQHLAVGPFLAANPRSEVQALMLVVAAIGLALAVRRSRLGWILASIGVFAGPLSAAFFGQWSRVVVPVHRLAAGLWIGTLFVLVAVGMTTVLRSALASERRDALVAAMVNGFSPLALASAGVVAVFGAITAWQHLHTLSALWTTPYGVTLIVKLLIVGVVLCLGAWNWRRQKPRLGNSPGTLNLRRTATTELIVAGLVLVVTSVLVSLPSPRPPGGPERNAPRPVGVLGGPVRGASGADIPAPGGR